MAQHVCAGAMLQCMFGSAPSSLLVLPTNAITTSMMPAATIMDGVPVTNIAPFGTCSSAANPAVVAAGGSPVPCVPATTPPWAPGSPTVVEGGQPALNNTSKLICTLGGGSPCISITNAGQQTVTIP